MKARLVRIGNSRGVRIPKPLIEEAGLTDEVQITVRQGAILIASAHQPRSGWADAARDLGERGEDRLMEETAPTRFDLEDWEW